jgi:hypothetical protein
MNDEVVLWSGHLSFAVRLLAALRLIERMHVHSLDVLNDL